MALYTFKCMTCDTESDKTMKMADAPRVGGVLEFPDPCKCGSTEFVRVMEKTPSSFRLNFRSVSL